MNDKDLQEKLKTLLKPIIEAMDSLPEGVFVPSTWTPPAEYTYEKFEVSNVPVEHISKKGKHSDKVIYYLHGGGYLLPLLDASRDCTIRFSQMADDADVFMIDYRIAPTDVFPAALEDSMIVYDYILSKGYDPNKMIVMGESAGGNLVLSTILYAKDHKRPVPKMAIAVSPWATLENTFPSRKYNKEKDLVLGSQGLRMRSQCETPLYAGNTPKDDPYLSPVHGNYEGFPDLLIQVGTYEILYSECLETVKRAKRAHVNVELIEYPRLSHCIQSLLPDLDVSKRAWKDTERFIKKRIRK